MTARRFATITIVKKTEFGDASPIYHWRNATLSNSLRSNNRSGVGRQSVVPFHSTTASPPTLLIPLQSGKTADNLRCAPEIHRLAFRLPHSVPPNHPRQCASAKKRSSALSASARQPQTALTRPEFCLQIYSTFELKVLKFGDQS